MENGGLIRFYIESDGYLIATSSRERLDKTISFDVGQDKNISLPSTLLRTTSPYKLFTWKWYLKIHLRAFNEDSKWETKVQLIRE